MSIDKKWGWVPNIPGNIFLDLEDVKSEVSEFESEHGYSYLCDDVGNKITVSDKEGNKAEINIRDKEGICSIHIVEKTTEDVDVWVNNVWKEFRTIFDSCSNEVCDCSAMDYPIESNESSVEKSIAEAFVDTMEDITDVVTYVKGAEAKTPKNWEGLMHRAMNMCNISRTNQVYFERFLIIYGEKFTDEEKTYFTGIMDARCEKAEIVYEHRMRRSELGYKKTSSDIALVSLKRNTVAIIISILTALIAAGALLR